MGRHTISEFYETTKSGNIYRKTSLFAVSDRVPLSRLLHDVIPFSVSIRKSFHGSRVSMAVTRYGFVIYTPQRVRVAITHGEGNYDYFPVLCTASIQRRAMRVPAEIEDDKTRV